MNEEKLAKIRKIACLDMRISKERDKLEELYKKIPVYKKLIEKEKNPEDEKILLYMIVSNNQKSKNAKIGYIHMFNSMSITIVSKDNKYLCTVFSQELLEALKKTLIILYLGNKEEK